MTAVQIQDEIQFFDYEEWKAAVTAVYPEARHNKFGQPGWVQGYGEQHDEEFVTGPDMQADVVAVWVTDDGFGYMFTKLETAATMKAEELVYFEIVEYNVFTRKRGKTHLMAASGDLLHAKVAEAAAKHIDADMVLLKPLLERPNGIVVVLTNEQVEAA